MKHQVFLVWFAIFLVWAFYRAKFFLPEYIDEFFLKPLIFVAPVIWVVVKKERKKLDSLGLAPKPKDFFLDLYLGVLIGVLFTLEGLLANYLKYGRLSFEPILASKVSGGIFVFFLMNLFTSFWEEILGRGYLYQRFLVIYKNQFHAAVSSSFLFLLLHIPIMFTRLHLTSVSLFLYPLSIFLLGITNSYLLSWRKNLTLPIFVHAFWNMTVALYL